MSVNPRMVDWHGRTVWLIGASSGIGRATASALHGRGASVVVSARNAAALQNFVAEHPGARALPLDVRDAQSVASAMARLVAQGRVDCVVYCAGHYRAMHAANMDLAELLRHDDINYRGALHLVHAVVPALLKQPLNPRTGQRAHISLMGSVAGYRGLPNSLAYGPTKAALINLAEVLHLDLRAHGVGISLINPGFVDTPLTRQNHFRMPALITPEVAASDILRGWSRGDFEIHFPRRFTWWMKLLRILPYRAFFWGAGRLQAKEGSP